MKENAEKARGLDAAEITKQLKDASEQMFRLRFQMSMGQMEGVKKYRALRKDRARIKTEQRDRVIKGGKAPAGSQVIAAKPVKAAAKAPAAKKVAVKKVAAAKPAVKKAAVKKTAVKKETK